MKETPGSIQSFIDYLKYEKRYSEHTIRSYHDDLVEFFKWLKLKHESMPLKEIGHVFIRSWLAELKEEDKTSKTINRKISSLKSFFKYQVRVGAIQDTPMSKVISPKNSKRLPSFVQTGQAKELLQSLESTESWKQLNTKMLITLLQFRNAPGRAGEFERKPEIGRAHV